MLGQIINLREYRRHKRELWRRKHHAKLDKFVRDFIDSDCPQLHEIQNYSFGWQADHQYAWDYQDFRDLLHNSLEELSRVGLYHRLRTQWWFDTTLISRDEVLELFIATVLRPQPQIDRESL